jgi:hypothetical protein
MRVTYNGPLEAVEVAVLGVVCERGKSIDVDPDIAEALAKQEDWYIRGRKTETAPEESN